MDYLSNLFINLNQTTMPTKSINEIIRQETGSSLQQDIQEINSNQKSNELVDKMLEVQEPEKQISDLSSEELDEIFSSDDTEFIDDEDWKGDRDEMNYPFP